MLLPAEDIAPIPLDERPRPRRRIADLNVELTKGRVPRKEVMYFSRQLAVFIKAGVPMLAGLETIRDETANKPFRRVLDEMLDALRGGATFATAAAQHPDAFPPFYLGILRSAELTGRLDTVLVDLSDYLDRDLDARNRIKAALLYPAVILVMAVFVVIVLVGFVLPRFETFFEDLDAELPLPTRMLLGVSSFLTTWWPVLLGGAVVLVVLAVVVTRTEGGHRRRDALLLRLPLVGDLLKHVLLERFCRILSSMVEAGVPLPDALDVTIQAAGNDVFREGLVEAKENMLRGEGLATPLAESGLFPASAQLMFRVGEDTGTLDEQLNTASVYFGRELDYKIKRFTTLFEPMVLIVVGVMVGFVAIAMVSAMYGIYNQVQV